MQRVRDTLAVFPQYVLPQHLLSRFMYRLARSRRPWLVQRLIALLCRHYPILLDEAEQSDPRAYASLNAFFTRALREGARPLPMAQSVDTGGSRVNRSFRRKAIASAWRRCSG
jgi:phosphatidylserine decarboxylase